MFCLTKTPKHQSNENQLISKSLLRKFCSIYQWVKLQKINLNLKVYEMDGPTNMVVAVVTFLTSSAKVSRITFFAQSVALLPIAPTSLVNGLVSLKLHFENCPQIFDKKITPNEGFIMGI